MNNTAAVALLRPIVWSAQLPVVESFHAATLEARRSLLSDGGGSRAIFPLEKVAVTHAHSLLIATWASLESALDKMHLDWTPVTLRELQVELGQMVDPVAAQLVVPVLAKQSAFPDVVAAAEQRIQAALTAHVRATEAMLVLYVADRRRREVQAVLSELENRLMLSTQGEMTLLGNVRGARREAEASSPDEGRLKQWLEVLSTSVQGIGSASDLGDKLQTLSAWFQ